MYYSNETMEQCSKRRGEYSKAGINFVMYIQCQIYHSFMGSCCISDFLTFILKNQEIPEHVNVTNKSI